MIDIAMARHLNYRRRLSNLVRVTQPIPELTHDQWLVARQDERLRPQENGNHANMTYEEFNQLCGSLPATSHVIQWGGSHVWKVGGKVFAIGGWEKMETPAFTFKTSELNYHFLRDQPGYRPAPYLASRGMKWIQQYDVAGTKDEELIYYLTESHRIVSLGLSKKKQKELGLNQD